MNEILLTFHKVITNLGFIRGYIVRNFYNKDFTGTITSLERNVVRLQNIIDKLKELQDEKNT